MFFIFDCNGQIVGNPNGYKTMAAAQGQYTRRKSAAYRGIWGAYDARTEWYEKSHCPMYFRRRNIMEIKLVE